MRCGVAITDSFFAFFRSCLGNQSKQNGDLMAFAVPLALITGESEAGFALCK
jgi:hypothetical protein